MEVQPKHLVNNVPISCQETNQSNAQAIIMRRLTKTTIDKQFDKR